MRRPYLPFFITWDVPDDLMPGTDGGRRTGRRRAGSNASRSRATPAVLDAWLGGAGLPIDVVARPRGDHGGDVVARRRRVARASPRDASRQLERLGEVLDQVVGMLDARPRAAPGRPAPRAASRRRSRGSSGPGTSISDSTPPSDSARKNSSVRRATSTARGGRPHPERHHAAEVRHLPGGDRVARVVGRAPGSSTGVTVAVGLQEPGDRAGPVAVRPHADGQGLQAAQREVAVHRPGHRADRVRRGSRAARSTPRRS